MADNADAPPPPIVPSQYAQHPDAPLSSLPVQLDPSQYTAKYPAKHLDAIVANWRLSCYLGASQIFLQSNAILSRKLTKDDVKPR